MPEFLINFLTTLMTQYDFEVINWSNSDPSDPDFASVMGYAARFMNMFNRNVDMAFYA